MYHKVWSHAFSPLHPLWPLSLSKQFAYHFSDVCQFIFAEKSHTLGRKKALSVTTMITYTPAQDQEKRKEHFQWHPLVFRNNTTMHTKLSHTKPFNSATHQSIDFREILVINDPVVKVNSFLVTSPVKSWSATAQLLVMCCWEKGDKNQWAQPCNWLQFWYTWHYMCV